MLDRARLESFRGKVFIAVGDGDNLAPPRELEAIAKGLDRVQFEVLDDTDHFFVSGPGLKDLRERLTPWLEF